VTIRPGFSRTVLYFWVLSWISWRPGFVLDLKSAKFDQLIFSKIIKIVATRCQISRLKCTKFDFGCGSAPDPAGGAYSTPPDHLPGLRGPTFKGKEERGLRRKGRERMEWKGREGNAGGEREGG